MDGLEGIAKLWNYFDSNSIRPNFHYRTEGKEPVTVGRIARMTRKLQLLTETQLKWFLSQFGTDMNQTVSSKRLEEVLDRLRPVAIHSHESQRSLLKLRKYIQETEKWSVVQAYGLFSSSGLKLEKWLLQLPCHLTQTDANRIGEAMSLEGEMSLDTWIKVLCGIVVKEIPRPSSTRSVRPPSILLSNEIPVSTQYQSFSTATRRPLTAHSLKSSQSVKQIHSNDNDCVSATHWSQSSSVQTVEDPVATEQPGKRMVETGRLMTNNPELKKTQVLNKRMRALRTFAYSGPGRHHEVLGELEAGGVVTVLEVNSVWAKVQCSGYEAWVPLCKLDEEVTRPIYSAHDTRQRPESAHQTGAVSQLYVRKQPGWSSQALQKLKAHEEVKVLGGTDNWVKVATSAGNRGWVPRAHTSLPPSTAPLVPALWSNSVSSHNLTQSGFTLTTQGLSAERMGEMQLQVESKMKSLEVEFQNKLKKQVERMELKRRFVRSWTNVELSRAFQRWHLKVFTKSKYDRFTAEQTQKLRLTRQASLQAIAVKKAARLQSIRSVRNLAIN